MGAGVETNGCFGNGQGGLFQASPQVLVDGHLCETTLQNGDRFISDASGGKNYTGNLADVFSCIAPLGESGCGFEQSLLAVTHALGADNFDAQGIPQPPPENAGFLRSDAALAIVMLTNEDDCSAPGGAMNELFSETATKRPLVPPRPRRPATAATSSGTSVGAPPAPPPRLPPNGDYGATVALQDCVPAEDAGRLISVQAFEGVIKALKPDPANQILVAAITGVYPLADRTAGYAVSWGPAHGPAAETDGGWPMMKHACSANDVVWADPAVRISAFTSRFSRGLLESICDDDWDPALQRIGAAIGDMMRPPLDSVGPPTPSCL